MKALLDMPVSSALLPVLEEFGHSGVHAYQIGKAKASDSELLEIAVDAPARTDDRLDDKEAFGPTCPRCQIAMQCIIRQSRPSWKKIFERAIYADPSIYSPMHHIQSRTLNTYPIDEYG